MSEFFDLAEQALNLEQPGKLWSNFGYWQQADQYPQACEALARQLAEAVELGRDQRVVDLGFGMGEQLRLWSSVYGVRKLIGLNPSPVQLEVARALDLPEGFQLHEAGAQGLSQCVEHDEADAVLALDCAYHFPHRPQIWRQIASALRPGGLFAWSDLLIPEGRSGLAARTARYAMCGMSQIPLSNVMREATYRAELQQAGLQLVNLERITANVFLPFASWWAAYRRRFGLAGRAYIKFELTARAVRAAANANCLDYAVLLARKPI